MTDLVLLKMRSQYSNSLHKTLSKNVLMTVIVWSYCYQGGLLNYIKVMLYFCSKSYSVQVNVKRQACYHFFPPRIKGFLLEQDEVRYSHSNFTTERLNLAFFSRFTADTQLLQSLMHLMTSKIKQSQIWLPSHIVLYKKNILKIKSEQ